MPKRFDTPDIKPHWGGTSGYFTWRPIGYTLRQGNRSTDLIPKLYRHADATNSVNWVVVYSWNDVCKMPHKCFEEQNSLDSVLGQEDKMHHEMSTPSAGIQQVETRDFHVSSRLWPWIQNTKGRCERLGEWRKIKGSCWHFKSSKKCQVSKTYHVALI